VLRAALADSSSRRFFAAHAQSCLGSGLAHVAMPLLAYEHTHSAWAVTAVLIPDLLPSILFGPLLGALVDRVGWRSCAIAADLLRMVAFTLVAFAHTLPWMVLGAALAGFGTALFTPAALSGVTRLARGERRPAGVGLFGALDDLGLTAGPALGVGLLALMAPAGLLGANAVTFAVSAVLLTTISPRRERRSGEPVEHTSLWTDLRVGLRAIGGRAEVRLLLASSTAAVLFAGVTNIGEVLLAREVLSTSASGLAAMVAAGGVGTVLGSLAARFRNSWEWRRAYIAGLCCMVVDLLLCAVIPSLWLLLPVFILGGFGNGFALVHDRLLLGAAVPDALHGRVFALQKALTSLAFATSFIGASALISVGGVQMTFALAGAGMLLVIAISNPRMRVAWPAPSAVTVDGVAQPARATL
jgi:MFS family permease